ncbi:MAG: photosynthetic complex assembly protein [Alphaproteobacteria bacterium]|nr:photosynthetic complex assembly protein [Alphaproteobacteria bacterium]
MSKMTLPAASPPSQASPGLLRAMLALILFAVLATGLGRWSDVGAVHMPSAYAVEKLLLKFEDLDDGGVAIRRAQDQSLLFKVEPGTNGFIRGTLRGLARERLRSGLGAEQPFVLIHWNNGSISLQDESTGRRVDLDAFGITNAQAFAQLFLIERAMK